MLLIVLCIVMNYIYLQIILRKFYITTYMYERKIFYDRKDVISKACTHTTY